jgi:hypothetical protein
MNKTNIAKKSFYSSKKVIRKLLKSLYYSYIGYKVSNLADKLTGYRIEKWRFFNSLGYYPDLKNPQSYNEKILWKKIYDRNPLLTVVADKYKVREYIKEVLGENKADKILIPLLHATGNP